MPFANKLQILNSFLFFARLKSALTVIFAITCERRLWWFTKNRIVLFGFTLDAVPQTSQPIAVATAKVEVRKLIVVTPSHCVQ
jgi:hypothetical protein